MEAGQPVTLFLEGTASQGTGNNDAVDLLYGNAGVASTLVAGSGADTLYVTGIAGTTLTGGAGADTFAFPDAMGHDEVTNFGIAKDIRQFNATLFENFSAAMADATQVGANTVFTIDANDTVALNNVVKGWRKRRDDDPTEIKDLNSDLPRLHLFISAPIKNLKKTDQRRTVEWQGGQLTCEVFEGSGQFEHKVGDDETHYLLSMHEKMPFGVAGATLNVKGDDGVTGTVEFRVIDFGANAISDLPDFK